MDDKLILTVLGKMQEYFGRQLKPEVQLMYVEQLQNLDEYKFRQASVNIMKEFSPTSVKPFPLIADFLEACGEDGKSRAINIVTMVRKKMEQVGQYATVTFGDRALHSVIERYGGWVEMVNNNTDEWWSLHERNFIAAYDSAKRAGFEGAEYLMGILEQDNRLNGYTPEKLLKMGINPEAAGYTNNQTKISEK